MKALPWKYRLVVVGFFFASLALSIGSARAATVDAQVDFSRQVQANNQIGFMHGAITHYSRASSRAAVSEKAIQLMPGMWRGVNQPWSFNLDLAQSAGARPIHVLSGEWNSSVSNPKAGCDEMFWDRPMPFQDLNAWKTWVAERAQVYAQNQPTGEIWVDIWNEPDWHRFWPTKRNDRCYSKSIVDTDGSKWLATFLAAEQTLRKTLGSRVKIIGPSAATSVMNWTTKLVDYCSVKGCRIDAVSWHLCGGTQGSVDLIGKYTGQLRTLFRSNAKWRKASAGTATQVLMTEYMPAPAHLFPGAYVSYWYALERAGVDGGALAEWNDPQSALNSLLESNGTPRSLWWTAKAYAAGRSSRVFTQTQSGYYSLLASRSGSSGLAQIVVGNNNSTVKTVRISLWGLRSLGAWKNLQTRIYALPQVAIGKGSAMPTLPTPVVSKPLAVSSSGTATIQVTPPKGAALLVDLAGS